MRVDLLCRSTFCLLPTADRPRRRANFSGKGRGLLALATARSVYVYADESSLIHLFAIAERVVWGMVVWVDAGMAARRDGRRRRRCCCCRCLLVLVASRTLSYVPVPTLHSIATPYFTV